jgi:hypothetical protein
MSTLFRENRGNIMADLPICPCCGQRLIPQDLALPPIKRRILDAVQRRPGISAEELRTSVWAADPNGGPENPKVIHVHIWQLNKALQLHRLRFRGSTSHGYRLVSTEEIAPGESSALARDSARSRAQSRDEPNAFQIIREIVTAHDKKPEAS